MNDLTNQSNHKYFVCETKFKEILDEYEDQDKTVCAICGSLEDCNCDPGQLGSEVQDGV